MFETGVVGRAARSSEEDKATESNRMREGNERAMESEEDVRERCTARYCLDVDTALLTFHLPGVSFCLRPAPQSDGSKTKFPPHS